MKKEEYLKSVEEQVYRKGYAEKSNTIRCSEELFNQAFQKGKKKRDAVYEKHCFWEVSQELDKASEAVRRHVACRDRFDNDKGGKLLKEYHSAMSTRELCKELVEKELEK